MGSQFVDWRLGRRGFLSPGGAIPPYATADFENDAYSGAFSSVSDVAFSTTSNGTLIGSDGSLKWRAHNLFNSTDDFATWNYVNITKSLVSGVEYKFVPNNTISGANFFQDTGTVIIPGETYTATLIIKDAGWSAISSTVQLRTLARTAANGYLGEKNVNLNITTGALGGLGGGMSGTYTVTDLGGGYLKVSLAFTTPATCERIWHYVVFSGTGNGTAGLTIQKPQLNRSSLGGMQVSPLTGDTYIAAGGSATFLRRFDYTGSVRALLKEGTAATNLLLNSFTLATQNVTVTAQPYTLHFTGAGTVTLSGASTAGPLVGTGAGEGNRVSLTFTPTAGTLTLTVTGTVTNAQLEAGSTKTSVLPTRGTTATRAAETASVTLPAGTYDVRVVTDAGTTDLTSVAHAGGTYWPAAADGRVRQLVVYPEGGLA